MEHDDYEDAVRDVAALLHKFRELALAVTRHENDHAYLAIELAKLRERAAALEAKARPGFFRGCLGRVLNRISHRLKGGK
jgi:hypothetical protein